MSKIHHTAIVEDGAVLGDDVIIEPYAFISAQAKIGSGTLIKQGARIIGDTTIGENSKIFSYAIVGDIPQDISFEVGEKTGLIIGKNATIHEFCTISSGSHKGDGFTRIGDNIFMMAYCHVAHDCILGDNIILANSATLAGHVQMGDYAVIGGLTPVHQFVKIGESCMIAGASALGQDIVPFCLAEGNRAYIRGLNLTGIRRRFDRDTVEIINKAYKFLFNQGVGLKEQAEILINETDNAHVKKMCDFILNTKRGIPLDKGRN
ncbi:MULTISPECIES: acyl-ACP--UDP-N-acetylglucosamine O-acyltransferase [unclassified Campylobacter]|uniref:acyl-ACP--UDP-N-acetylglucosamine O-acyltransferase n=1 Tax=unclassified Campylobacter TaxID=2593542 RepID=UPI0022E9E9C0|nr:MULTISPECIES: acyl-ACP--UDP-N-acetylglucosamine O-acyltransferase [unclassified Campylobacter]MDA3045512.1 acyl-ACP--UDP-N-acetylglucosamine O-acyltransferase [Campylobacter sp. JMF_07 ED4]MDA3050144.1 acyl-ACP--UDP-N-acetylglucosamine O-acyltransferase [Campylobacter sp. JMF_15 NE4]MDA3055167.1 acyl-ACP--UDP-N-acetylglucosamine O-acyltransferase [Campylobacter sp. VBCF_07 NA4]MDA3061419.1 acyl-ACP--UDP-N-acetylglucosamine O-acyltransferase [Campylobacter sp. VBCF_02 NA5]MDA3070936.1 acyl-A